MWWASLSGDGYVKGHLYDKQTYVHILLHFDKDIPNLKKKDLWIGVFKHASSVTDFLIQLKIFAQFNSICVVLQ